MSRTRSCPSYRLPLLVLALAYATPLAAQFEKPPPGISNPTIIPAGPSWLSAAGFIPTRLILKWRAVPNAVAYRVFRASTYEPRRMVWEATVANMVASKHVEMETGDLWSLDFPVDMTSTYTYDVQAVFVDATGQNYSFSTPSPKASAKSPPYVAPADFKYTVSLDPRLPGRVTVNFSWSPVPNAGGYELFMTGQRGSPTLPSTKVQGTSRSIPDLAPKTRYNACIVTAYYPGIQDNNVKSCIDVKL